MYAKADRTEVRSQKQAWAESTVRSLFTETSIHASYKLVSFNHDANTFCEITTATFDEIELAKLLIKTPELPIQKILTRRKVRYLDDFSGNSHRGFDKSVKVMHSLWFNNVEDANTFYQKLDLEIATQKGRYWEARYLRLNDNCIKMIPTIFPAAVTLLSSNTLLQPMLDEYINAAKLPIQTKAKTSLLNPSKEEFFPTVNNVSFPMNSKNILLLILKKCSLEDEHGKGATFEDIGNIFSVIKFPKETTKEHLITISDKFSAAGLSCRISGFNFKLEIPQISIDKSQSELEVWVKEPLVPQIPRKQPSVVFPHNHSVIAPVLQSKNKNSSEKELLCSLMEKCSIDMDYSKNATFADLTIHSAIEYPKGTTADFLRTIANKFIEAGLPCSIDTGGTYIPPRITIEIRKKDLEAWVAEKNSHVLNKGY